MNKNEESKFDDVELARRINQDLDNEENAAGYGRQSLELQNISLTEADMHMVGDGIIISQVVQLISYIRHAVKNNSSCEIKLKFGRELANAQFNFSVNGFQIPDLIPQPEVQIN